MIDRLPPLLESFLWMWGELASDSALTAGEAGSVRCLDHALFIQDPLLVLLPPPLDAFVPFLLLLLTCRGAACPSPPDILTVLLLRALRDLESR